MTINIYDDMNKLEATLRKMPEYAAVKEAIEVVKADEEARAMFDSFRQVQVTLQQKQMQGEEITGEELEHAQKTAQLAQSNPKIMEMLSAEMELSNVIEEINRVVMRPVQELYEDFNK